MDGTHCTPNFASVSAAVGTGACCEQVYNSADQGQAIIASYHLEQLPAVLIVDPVTGAKVWERSGFISSDTLIEELVPFMDAGK
jgi:hypothetical protein